MAANLAWPYPEPTQATTGSWRAAPKEWLSTFVRKASHERASTSHSTGVTLQEGDQLVVSLDSAGGEAGLTNLVERLNELGSLGADWDSYGALRPSAAAILSTARFLLPWVVVGKPLPAIVPVSDGTIQLEWHRLGRDLELSLDGNDQIGAYFEDHVTGEVKERYFDPGASGLQKLVDLVTQDAR